MAKNTAGATEMTDAKPVRTRRLVLAVAALTAFSVWGCDANVMTGSTDTLATLGETVEDSTIADGNCNVAYYNDELSYGFDLPASSELFASNVFEEFVFDAVWVSEVGASVVNVSFATHVVDLQISLSQYVRNLNTILILDGAEFFLDTVTTLEDGRPAYLSVYETDSPAKYVYTISSENNGRAFSVSAITFVDLFTEDLDLIMTDAVLSLCVGE